MASLVPLMLAAGALAAVPAAPPETVATAVEAAASTKAAASTEAEAFCAAEASGELPDALLESRGAVIGGIEVRVGDIFDPTLPGEDRLLFRWANRLHRTTRDRVILQQLVFAPGDPYSRRRLDESERLLRNRPYLYDAVIRPLAYHDGNRVDVEVVTRDVWTLNAGASYGRKGGESSLRFKLEDTNFLGTGKYVALEQVDTVDRSGVLASYLDPNLVGSRVRFGLGYADNSDGASWHLGIGQPFFALDSRWMAGLAALGDDRVDSRYLRGQVTDRFRHRESGFELSGGLSRGLHLGRADRWTAGLTYSSHRFAPDPEDAAPSRLPEDRTLAYPWIGFEHVEDSYIEDTDLDKLGRTEDHFVGRSFRARLGLSSPLYGGDRERLVFDGGYRGGWELPGEQLVDLAARAAGRWGGDGAENLVVGATAAYYWRDFGRNVFYAGVELGLASRLDLDQQLTLGGDSGLRGYPLRYQDGDRRVLLTLEQRIVTDWSPFHLVKVGGAVFFDAGRAWFAGEPGGPVPGGGVLTDVGLGLRLGHTRSGHGSMVHLDLAFPLNGDGSIESPQWLVQSHDSF